MSFYHATIESIITYCLCVWYLSCTVANKRKLQRVIRMAEKVIGYHPPTLEDLHSSHCHRRANNVIRDTSHPGYSLVKLLPSGRWYRAIKTKTNRLKNSF